MELERTILQLVEEVLKKIGTPATNIAIEKEEGIYRVNIETEDTNLLIGYHGETIKALEHVLRLLLWKKVENPESNIVIDIENYRKRQEKNVIEMAEKKAEYARKTMKTQILPPMSPYFRRLVHIHFTQPQFSDLETASIGEGDRRQLTIKSKTAV
jgi:spoIIIJ-associated protein